MSARWSRRGAALAVAALVLASAGVAHAASLGVASADVAVVTGTAPCAGRATVTASTPASAPATTTLAVTVSDPACVGRTLTVAVLGGQAVLAQAVVVPTSTSTTVTVPAFSAAAATGAVAAVDGWALEARWVAGGQVVPGTATTVLVGDPQWYTATDGRSCVRVSATTSTTALAATQTTWAVDLRVTSPPFPGPGATYVVVEGDGQVQVAPSAPAGVVRLVGKNGNETLKPGQTRTFSVCW